MITGHIELPKMAGQEVRPGIVLIDEPTPVPGTNKLRALADVHGTLCLVELKIVVRTGART